jgi:1-acyl-sn-glycerol-3-phosphate acyltransferase
VFNAAPVDRTLGGREALPSDLLHDGYHMLMFPEGTRSTDGYAGRFRHGAAHLAIEAGVPIVPIAIRGSWRAMPKGQNWPSRGRPKVQVAFGSPLHPVGSVSELTKRLRTSIAELLDQQRTDWWTALRNAQRGSTPGLEGPDISSWRRRWELLDASDDDGDDRVWRTGRRAS